MTNKLPTSGTKTNRPLDPEDPLGTVDAWHTNTFGNSYEQIPHDQLSLAASGLLGIPPDQFDQMDLEQLAQAILQQDQQRAQ